MPQSTHNRSAELHNLTEHIHDAAAAHDKADHLTSHELTKQADEHSKKTHEHDQVPAAGSAKRTSVAHRSSVSLSDTAADLQFAPVPRQIESRRRFSRS
jgi:hypothetical protein